MTDIDWDELRQVATEAMAKAYAPYSRYKVGAAALVGDLHMSGGGQLVAFVCVNNEGQTIMPCGRCRQLLFEHAMPGMLLETVSGIRTIDEVLPDAFGPRALRQAQGPEEY